MSTEENEKKIVCDVYVECSMTFTLLMSEWAVLHLTDFVVVGFQMSNTLQFHTLCFMWKANC